MNKKLEKARELYIAVRTMAEQLKVDQQQRQVDRTGNAGGRAHQHLVEAQGNLDKAMTAAGIEFQTAIDSVEEGEEGLSLEEVALNLQSTESSDIPQTSVEE